MIKRTSKPIAALFIYILLPLGYCPNGSAANELLKVPEIPDPRLPDIALVTKLPGQGNVIYYNPIICAHAGAELCEFYRAHEYGHIALGHTETSGDIKRKELEADCWAAKHAPAKVVKVAYDYFSAGGGKTPLHGNGAQRAARIDSVRNSDALGVCKSVLVL